MYKRKTNLFIHFSRIPFIVKSRTCNKLTEKLIEIGFPILYEGLNSTRTLDLMSRKGIKTFVRLHNIEHNYYKNIGKLEDSFFKKIYYLFEAYRLKKYQSVLKNADILFTISPKENIYFSSLFNNVVYLPVFQSKKELLKTESSQFCLFHGDLRLSDNIRAAEFLISFFSVKTDKKLVIASSFENLVLNLKIKKSANIVFEKIEFLSDLELLFSKTAVHILLSYQSSGIKLKLLNSLFTDSYVLSNHKIIEGTELETCCELFETEEDLLLLINKLYGLKISLEERVNRLNRLKAFNTNNSIQKIISNL
ncbi:hypothetical protein [Olleya sp. HaHaR_3_96]|uniref:hypothetical protein n=1 Tax=Olleya sp. HaHaR_3_96 TaxID=2745560 RepID=UPI001C4F0BE6|nr:hypothetical protein [Olleya sp. HaHaR_3_96]QXP59907.1 hypothetical protein H0I26_18685 [Olleya sp. HaHaR_3_96]